MKERILAVCLTAILVMSIWGCGSEYDERKIIEEKQEEIVLWSYYETEEQKLALDELIAGFNKAQETYHITWEYHGPVTEFTKKLSIGITQGQLPDIVILDNPDMRKYVEQDIFADVTEYVTGFDHLDKYYENVLSSVIYDGKYYGLPFCCNNTALIYNQELLEESGLRVPETWDELLETAVMLGEGERTGFAMSAIAGEQSAFQLLPFILSAGDTVETLGGQGTREAFEYMKTLVDEGALSRDSINWSQNDLAKKFIDGECAMMQNGPWVLPALDAAGISYGIAPLPMKEARIGVAGGENLGVIKGKNTDGAVAFLQYYNNEQTMLNTALRANSMPPRKDLAVKMVEVRPEYKIFVEQMDECVSRSAYETWPQITGILSEAQYKVISGEASPAEVTGWLVQ